MGNVARESIAFGQKESLVYPPPAGFVAGRETILAGQTLTSPPVQVGHSSDFGLAVSVILVDNATAALYALSYQVLVYSDGLDGATGGYKNPIWGPSVLIVAAGAVNVATYTIGAIAFPATQAIRLLITNNGANATAAKPDPTIVGSLGVGLHVRVAQRSRP